MKDNINPERILEQFALVETSIKRAKLPFETDMVVPQVMEVTLYECLKSIQQLRNIISDIGHPAMGPFTTTVTRELTVNDLSVCPYCGNPECNYDHK
jgi:hypothetical protein